MRKYISLLQQSFNLGISSIRLSIVLPSHIFSLLSNFVKNTNTEKKKRAKNITLNTCNRCTYIRSDCALIIANTIKICKIAQIQAHTFSSWNVEMSFSEMDMHQIFKKK